MSMVFCSALAAVLIPVTANSHRQLQTFSSHYFRISANTDECAFVSLADEINTFWENWF